jgi:hypothetical protein
VVDLERRQDFVEITIPMAGCLNLSAVQSSRPGAAQVLLNIPMLAQPAAAALDIRDMLHIAAVVADAPPLVQLGPVVVLPAILAPAAMRMDPAQVVVAVEVLLMASAVAVVAELGYLG